MNRWVASSILTALIFFIALYLSTLLIEVPSSADLGIQDHQFLDADASRVDLLSLADLSHKPYDLSDKPTNPDDRKPGSPLSPGPPAPGEQEIVKLEGHHRSCVTEVEGQVKDWAYAHNMTVRVAYASTHALDIELYPFESSFESECMLFEQPYAADATKINRLREYLISINFTSNLVKEQALISKGFTPKDAYHLREHLDRFIQKDRYLSKNRLYSGIRYFRVTYSNRPNSEFTINTGTVEGYTLTGQQRNFREQLRDITKSAALCD